MEMVTVSSKYQIVIPRKIREQYNLQPGQKLVFIPRGSSLRLVVVPSIDEAYGILKDLGIDAGSLREEQDEER